MKDSIARARQIRTAEQTQAEVAEIRAQINRIEAQNERIEARLDELLAANAKVSKKPANNEKAGA